MPQTEPKAERDYAGEATQYALDVLAGDYLANKYHKLACERHLRDLERPELHFSEARSADMCSFKEQMRHIKGDKAGELYVMEPWQIFKTCVQWGWEWQSSGKRRFRRAYTKLPRGQGKSFDKACEGLYTAFVYGEAGAEVYSGATSLDQAWEVFRPARVMCLQDDELCDAFGIKVNAKSLERLRDSSKFEPIIAKPGDGQGASHAIADEVHEMNTAEQMETMETGMIKRSEPMLDAITTAGFDIAGPCYRMEQVAERVLRGDIVDDAFFVFMTGIDRIDQWNTEEGLRMANPNYGVSVDVDVLWDLVRQAENDPTKQSVVQRKHLNWWTGARDPWINLANWSDLGDTKLRASDFKGCPCYVGIDLASKVDLAAVITVFEKGGHYYCVEPRFYLPSKRADDPELSHYGGWSKQGFLTKTPGARIDINRIEQDVLEICQKYGVLMPAIDPSGATDLEARLMDHSLEPVEVLQHASQLSDPMKKIHSLVEDGKFHHDSNPVMNWCIANTKSKPNAKEQEFPNKESAEMKIDGAVACILAMRMSMIETDDDDSSGWGEDGLHQI